MKKLVCVFLCCVFLCTLLPMAPAAAQNALGFTKILVTDAARATILEPALPADPNNSMEKRPDAALMGGEGSQKGEAGVEFKIFAESDGYMMINVSYDHAHNTGGPVKLAFHINHPQSQIDGFVPVEMKNLAAPWGTYNVDRTIIQVQKGENTLRIASNQDSTGWMFYINYIEYSKVFTDLSQPAYTVDAPRPEKITDKIEFEILENNANAKIDEITDGPGKGGLMVNNLKPADAFWKYPALDFGSGQMKSLDICYKGAPLSDPGYLEFVLDDPNGQPIAQTALTVYSDFDWETINVPVKEGITGVHTIYVRPVRLNAGLDYFQFQTTPCKNIAYTKAQPGAYRDVFADTWAATDDLGRKTPSYAEVGDAKDKKVGIFYIQWFDWKQGSPLFDHQAAYEKGGVEEVKSVMMAGNQGQGQYWGQPYFGYYRSDDEWILRKHATQLCNAGIDFIYLDASNNYNYPHIASRIFEVWQQMRNEGLDTPQIAYFMGADTAFSTKQIMDVYYYIYRDNKFSDLWFMWEGKPLILGDRDAEVPQEIKNLFSFRYCWAFDSQKRPDFKDYWPWGQNYPQKPGKSPTGEIEQMTVMCGGWASSSDGRSFAGGKLPDEAGGEDFEFDLKTSAQGLMYDEHWSEALKVDPKVVMLCGWNEWIAGRCVSQSSAEDNWFANTYMVDHTDPVKSSYFLDNFNLEFSRDLEPMTGGYKDNYYYQTVQNIRKFKGVRPQPAAYGEREIEINGDFVQWDGVGPVYRDTKGDTTHRNSTANAGSDVYVNNSGRNDITDAKAMLNGGRAYFYVKTNDEITPPSGTNWMNLFINADNNAQTGWQGYDFVINRAQDGGKAKIERFSTNAWQPEEAGWADLFYENNQLHLGADAALLGLDKITSFSFKWADNSVSGGDIMQFLDQGDAAPNDRFCFVYSKTGAFGNVITPALEAGAVAMQVGRPTALKGTQHVLIDPQNTSVVPTIIADRTLVPLRFVAEAFGAAVSWDQESQTAQIESGGDKISVTIGQQQIVVNGKVQTIDTQARIIADRTFVPLRAISEAFGKTVIWDPSGSILIGKHITATDQLKSQMRNALR